MSVRIPRRETHHGAAAWLRWLAAAVAAVTRVLMAPAAIIPAAWAVNVIPAGGGTGHAPARAAATAGGMPGWQVTLIALGAALAAATAAVLLDRARAARRAASAPLT